MKRWLWSLPAKIVEFVIAAAIAIAVTDHYTDHVRLNTRTWLFSVAVLVVAGAVAVLTAWLVMRARPAYAVPPPTGTEEPEPDERQEAYAEHVRQILDHLRQVIEGEMPHLDYREFIERGILEPARDMLRQDPEEDIRLSILAADEEHFDMPLAAGHSLPSRERFRLRIADSISRFAYERRETFVWDDLRQERAYTPHPRATRPYCSMISVPVCGTDEIYGVFNVISTLDHAFDDADIEYVKTLASIINVAAGLIVAERVRAGEEEDDGE